MMTILVGGEGERGSEEDENRGEKKERLIKRMRIAGRRKKGSVYDVNTGKVRENEGRG